MPAIKPTCIRDIKMRVNIVDVVSRVATLKKAGNRFKGLCPFHNEKTPSFHVDPDKGYYKCFGCGKAGDIISFVSETEQLNFTETLETLGQRFGIPIEYEEGSGPSREERSLRQELFDLHELAAEHYHQIFREQNETGQFMRKYWTESRRFSMELAGEFKVGAAPAADQGLIGLVLQKRFSEEALRQSGLFFIRDGALPSLGTIRCRFRGRLMIPIRDHQGRVVAFTARQTDLTPDDDPAREAKYVNSPETPIFTKGHLLFNLDRARKHVDEEHPFVMVEGQLDALRCWSVGLKTAIAPQGTAITESQLQLLRRYHHQVECFFDGDNAGQKAALRFLPLALKTGLEARFIVPHGEGKIDPDLLFLEQGLKAYHELHENALSAMAFACRCILPDASLAGAEQKTRAVSSLFEIIQYSESEVARSQFLRESAGYLRIPSDAMLKDYQAKGKTVLVHRASEPPLPKGIDISAERHLLMLCLHFEMLGKLLSVHLPHDWIDPHHLEGALLNRFLAEFENDSWPGKDHLDEILESEEERSLTASLLFETLEIDDPVAIAAEGIRRIRDRALQPRLKEIELALAESSSNSIIDPISLIKERTEIQRLLRSPIRLG